MKVTQWLIEEKKMNRASNSHLFYIMTKSFTGTKTQLSFHFTGIDLIKAQENHWTFFCIVINSSVDICKRLFLMWYRDWFSFRQCITQNFQWNSFKAWLLCLNKIRLWLISWMAMQHPLLLVLCFLIVHFVTLTYYMFSSALSISTNIEQPKDLSYWPAFLLKKD